MQKKFENFLKKYLTLAGVVRRIDELGRIVVPKEIRRVMRIREGDPLQTTLTNDTETLEAAEIADLQEKQFVTSIITMAQRIGIQS